jgi:phage shock protein PspC (stress-responsive transcriptional regulator)
LYRDVENGMLAGVCAGIADYFGISRKVPGGWSF